MSGVQRSQPISWSPPPRPEWVRRLNDEGRYLDIAGIVPLDPQSLIDRAIANTRLSDFGDPDWRAFFDAFVASLDAEAQLNLMGRILTRSDILMFLEARLRVEDAYRRHPEIEDQRIEQPLWIFGQGRSGTSMLQTLLGLDPANRTTTVRDALFPMPVPGDGVDHGDEIADARITMWNRVTPELVSIHEFAAEAPTESIHLECLSFRTPAWLNLLGLTPSYNALVAKYDYAPSFEYLKRVVKLLQWQGPRRRWVFKSPDAIGYLPELLRVFPDVRLIWSHRDPIKAMSSAVNMIGTLTWLRSDRTDVGTLYEDITDPPSVAASLSRPIEWIESGAVPREQLCNIQYADLIADPIATVGAIYDFFGLEFLPAGRAAIRSYLDAHPRSERPAHRYATGSGDRIGAERAAFRRYQDYFGVPNET